jgi:hypothetical protein
MTPSQNIRYVFELSEDGVNWVSYTGNFYSDAQAYVEVSQPGITSLTANTQIRVRYTTNFSSGSLPNISDPTTVSVTVNPLPAQPTISASSYSFCQNSDLTFASTTPSGIVSTTWTSSNINNATVGPTGIVHGLNQGNSIITYTITDANGCQSKDAKPITVNPTPIISNISDAVCSGVQYNKNPSLIPGNSVPTGTTYDWIYYNSTAGGLSGMIGANGQSDFNALLVNNTNNAITATYRATATKGSCSSAFEVALNVTPAPLITNRTLSNICSGTVFTVQPTNGNGNIVPAGITYSWASPSVPSGISNQSASGTPSPTIFIGTLINSTNVSLTVNYTVNTSNSGCQGSNFIVTVVVQPTPVVNARSVTICSGASFNEVPTNGTKETLFLQVLYIIGMHLQQMESMDC